jgi:hypothetical protein
LGNRRFTHPGAAVQPEEAGWVALILVTSDPIFYTRGLGTSRRIEYSLKAALGEQFFRTSSDYNFLD